MTPDITILSAKALLALSASCFLAASDYVVASIPGAEQDGLLQYGVLGIACIGLVYGIKTLHGINQRLQNDMVNNLKEGEKQRLADRDVFFDRIENMLNESNTSREGLKSEIQNLVQTIKEKN
jgi:hypothetical protein